MRALRTVAGFTLIELITVLILVGILAVTALPRMFDRNTFESRGFFDETKSILRYAQKSAIAQRRDVCVTFAGTGAALRIAYSGVLDRLDPPVAAAAGLMLSGLSVMAGVFPIKWIAV